MPRETNILSISLPSRLARSVDELARLTEQNRSELIRSALRSYIMENMEDRERFLKAYRATRREPTISLKRLKKKYRL